MSTSKDNAGPPKGGWVVPWVIRPKNLYLIHAGEPKENLAVSGELLAECTAAGHLSGNFRWAFGGGNANAGFGLRCVVHFENAPAYFININMKPDEIEIRNNTTSGKWADLVDWIVEGKVAITSNDDSTELELLGKLSSLQMCLSYANIISRDSNTIHLYLGRPSFFPPSLPVLSCLYCQLSKNPPL